MALAGVAYSCMVVSSFSRAQTRVLEMGFADDINTYVMISGNVIICTENRWAMQFCQKGDKPCSPLQWTQKIALYTFFKV